MRENKKELEEYRKERKVKKHKWSKAGCEKQYDFNESVRDIFCVKLRKELAREFGENGIPSHVEDVVKEGESAIVDRNHKLKIADDYGFDALEVFEKEDLARNEKEEKKLKMLKKEAKEKKEKLQAGRRMRTAGFRERREATKGNGKNSNKEDVVCYRCDLKGHFARDCRVKSEKKNDKKRN